MDAHSREPQESSPSDTDPLRTFLPLPPAEGLSEWFFGEVSHSNDGGAKDSNRVILFVATTETPGVFAVSSLARLLLSRRRLKDSLHTIVVTAPEVTRRVHGILRAGRVRTGVSVFEAPDSTRLNALFSLAAAMPVPSSRPAAGTRSFASDSAPFRASAAGVPVVPWPSDTPLPAHGRELVVPSRASNTREASRAARYRALAARVDVATHEPNVWEPPTHLYRGSTVTDRPQRIVVAGHDMKFAHAAIDELRALGHEVQLDEWAGHARHSEERSQELLAWADVVWCEWTLGNAAWYSAHADENTRLVTRLHLQELATTFPAAINWENVDATVVVADHVRRQLLRDSDAREERTAVIPNLVDIPETVAEHDDVSRFRLGLVGMVPARKGLREALDVLEALRAKDSRYTLSLRGKRPEEYPWMADRPAESEYFDTQLARIEEEPLLRGAVKFSPFGPDMAEWYKGIGVVLSTSEYESFHYTAPDGAVHGSLPFLLSWPGADLLYPSAWLHPDTEGMARAIREATQDADRWRERVADARQFITEAYCPRRVLDALVQTILGAPKA